MGDFKGEWSELKEINEISSFLTFSFGLFYKKSGRAAGHAIGWKRKLLNSDGLTVTCERDSSLFQNVGYKLM